MRKWMRDRNKRRNKGQAPNKDQAQPQQQGDAPLQPTFLDRDTNWSATAESAAPSDSAEAPQPEYEAPPEVDPNDSAGEDEAPAGGGAAGSNRRERSRRRGRGGRGRNRGQQQQQPPALPIAPGQATGEAAEVDGVSPQEPEAEPVPAKPTAKQPKGAVVLAIGLPGSGKSSWFKRHDIIPLSSDLIRGLLFDDPTEQRYQDLVFSTLRSLLRARLIANRPMNYIDATNLSPKERHSWIRMAHDFNYEAHAVFFDVPTEICMERNRKRSRNVPDEVMLRMAQKLRPPKFEEGLAKITIVRLKKQERPPAVIPEPFEPSDEGGDEA